MLLVLLVLVLLAWLPGCVAPAHPNVGQRRHHRAWFLAASKRWPKCIID